MSPADNPPEPSIRLILEVVSELTGLSVSAIRSVRRAPEVVVARHMTCWLALRLTSLALPQIGMEMGGRDRSSVEYGARCMDELRASHPELRERLDVALGLLPMLAAAKEIARASCGPDPAATVSRILSHHRPELAAGLASTQEVVAMAVRVRQLDLVAEIAARFLSAQERALAGTEAPIVPADLPASDADDAACSAQRTHLAEALAALGYVTFKDEEKALGNAD
ncbi:helix-turn-helix domain-containing protein [Xanthobacter flavus]|uniref:helix-turn-helix domain-containing protein n=1 Tax=Xanthobacter flavus TaxID=281 RepID=UPI00372BFB5A